MRQGREDPQDLREESACLVVPAAQAHLDQWERKALRGRKVQWARSGRTALKGRWVFLGWLDLRGLLEKMETRVKLEALGRKEVKETRENWAHPDPLAIKALSDTWDPGEPTETQDPGGSRECTGPRGMKEPGASVELQAPLDCRVCQVHQERRGRAGMLA